MSQIYTIKWLTPEAKTAGRDSKSSTPCGSHTTKLSESLSKGMRVTTLRITHVHYFAGYKPELYDSFLNDINNVLLNDFHISELKIDSNNLLSGSLIPFSKFLQYNRTLSAISLRNVKLKIEDFDLLVETLPNCPNITKLDLGFNNSIGEHLPEFVATNTTITHLEVDGIRVPEQTQLRFIGALECNTTLVYLKFMKYDNIFDPDNPVLHRIFKFLESHALVIDNLEVEWQRDLNYDRWGRPWHTWMSPEKQAEKDKFERLMNRNRHNHNMKTSSLLGLIFEGPFKDIFYSRMFKVWNMDPCNYQWPIQK